MLIIYCVDKLLVFKTVVLKDSFFFLWTDIWEIISSDFTPQLLRFARRAARLQCIKIINVAVEEQSPFLQTDFIICREIQTVPQQMKTVGEVCFNLYLLSGYSLLRNSHFRLQFQFVTYIHDYVHNLAVC